MILEDKEEIGLILRDNTQAHRFFYQSGHWTIKHSMPTPLIKQMGSFYKISLQIPFCLQLTLKQVDKDNFLLNNAKLQVFYQRLWARLLRCLESTKRQFSKTQFWWYIWLGNVCGIAFLISQIFIIYKMQFPLLFQHRAIYKIVLLLIFSAENLN